ncbi:hypothetical protein GALMADRAFT_148204 [Galerina marginata CBS 339.88]|uniref:Uncharacterized protein n=1 Tax=Galerina marginata (strain CBS 339.88) TaxID=685588 RepID=A0A067SH18_GALM3|nr:hypothetical protein GALMADRAFT_148204 [Galerina marginata CBS 339.88]
MSFDLLHTICAIVIQSTGNNTLALVPERQFLEWITPYTGPTEQFRSSENLALYFTLTALSDSKQKRLYMTVFHLNKQIAITIHWERGGPVYVDSDVTCNRITSEMEAKLQLTIGEQHPWRTNNAVLLNELAKYYESITRALNWIHLDLIAALQCKWNLDLVSNNTESNKRNTDRFLKARSLRDQLYLDRGYEHHLKAELIENWGEWILKDNRGLRSDALHDCYYAAADTALEKAKFDLEIEQLDAQLTWEWTRREMLLLCSSSKLEVILERPMGECIIKVANGSGNERLKEWMWSEFVSGRRKRLEKERKEMKQRVESEMKAEAERAKLGGRVWEEQESQWGAALEFIDTRWSAEIEQRQPAPKNAASEINRLVEQHAAWPYSWEEPIVMLTFVEPLRRRFRHWHNQRENERLEIDATIKRIGDANDSQWNYAYQYPQAKALAAARFVILKYEESISKIFSATVYDVKGAIDDTIYDVIKKSTTRSVINKRACIRSKESGSMVGQANEKLLYILLHPDGVNTKSAHSFGGTIAHIFIFLETRSRVQLRLLHRQSCNKSVSIQENSIDLRVISTDEIPDSESEDFQLQNFDLGHFELGRHQLKLVVMGTNGTYYLRDIFVEFNHDQRVPYYYLDNVAKNLAAIAVHGGADREPN